MNIKKTVVSVFGANIFTSIASVAGIIYFSRTMGTGVLGTYFLFISVLGLIGFLANLGLPSAVEKRISEKQPSDEILTTALVMEAFLLVPFVVTIILFSNQLSEYLGAEVSILLIIALVVQQLGTILRNALEGELRVQNGAWYQSLQKSSWLLFGFLISSQNLASEPLILSHIASLILMNMAVIITIDAGLGKPKIKHMKSLFDFSKYSILGAAGGKLYNWGDVLILGFFVSSSAIGAYEIAWRVSQSVMLLAQSIRRTIYPQISAWDSEDEHVQIKQLVSDAILPSAYMSIPAFFGALLYSRQILELVFTSEAGVASMALIILMAEKIVRSIHMTISPAIMALDRPDLILIPVAIVSVSNLALNLPLIWKFGISGAALGTGIASIFGAVAYIHQLDSLIGLDIPWNGRLWCVISSVFMVLILQTINYYIVPNGVLVLITLIGLGAAIYVGASLIHRPIREFVFNSLPR
jgi:O-antigen/teichoic acid export membrane protein